MNVLTSLKRIRGMNWISFLYLADKNLRDRIKIDWGSFAWKGSKEEILKLVQEWHGELEEESILVDGVEYGVVL